MSVRCALLISSRLRVGDVFAELVRQTNSLTRIQEPANALKGIT